MPEFTNPHAILIVSVQRYLPNAAAARKTFLVKAGEVEEHLQAASDVTEQAALKEWRDIYRYSFDQNLTGCVVQLEEMEKQTKLIVGEQGWVSSHSLKFVSVLTFEDLMITSKMG